jgi:hypothetical protein
MKVLIISMLCLRRSFESLARFVGGSPLWIIWGTYAYGIFSVVFQKPLQRLHYSTAVKQGYLCHSDNVVAGQLFNSSHSVGDESKPLVSFHKGKELISQFVLLAHDASLHPCSLKTNGPLVLDLAGGNA